MSTIFRKILRSNAKHKKLSEEWALADCDSNASWWESTVEGCGTAMYAGTATSERAASGPATAKAVQSALHTAKVNRKKMRKVNLSITRKGVVATDAETSENILNISIYRISFCSADGSNARVFAVVEGSEGDGEEIHTAHVFVCERRRHARAFALSLAHAFNDAFQAYQSSQQKGSSKGIPKESWVSFSEESEDQNKIESWNDNTPPLVSFA